MSSWHVPIVMWNIDIDVLFVNNRIPFGVKQSKKCNYNSNLIWISKIPKRIFPCVTDTVHDTLTYLRQAVYQTLWPWNALFAFLADLVTEIRYCRFIRKDHCSDFILHFSNRIKHYCIHIALINWTLSHKISPSWITIYPIMYL